MDSLNGKQQGGDSNLAIQAYIQDLLDIAIRRKWLILSIVIVSVAISGVYAWFKPELYRSSTVILVEHQKIPENYVRSVVSGRVAERVSTITQQVLSRTSLQKVIEELQLFPQAVKEHGYEAAIGGMRSNVKLVTKGSRGRLDTFKISFTHSDPMTAMKVTAKLASQYIEENLKLREQFVEGASEFLEQELATIKQELDEKEKMISEFKLRYLGELPGQLESNLRTLDRLQGQNGSIQESANSLSMRLELIQKSIHDYESIAGALADLPTDAPRGGPMDPLVMERQKIEKELAKLSMEYTDAYPDVVMLQNHLEKVKAQLEEKQDSPEDVTLESVSEEDDSNSSMNTRLSSLDPYVLGLQNTRDDIKTQIASLRVRQKRVLSDMEIYKGRIERTPAREQELLILERDYANIQRNYQHLHGKRLNSRISENLEKKQKAERFRILDPANLPTKPDGPPRYLIVLAGLAIGCGLGYGSAFALEQWKPTFRRSEDAEVSIGFPILATIPSFQMAYGKSFKSLPHQAYELTNGHGEGNASRSGYLGSVVPAKTPAGKLKDFKNGFPSELGLVTKWRPGSIVAEQYRVAATRLSLMGAKSTSTVILVTSAMKNEGKTSTVANLAYTLARDLDEPTLVIDCDFKCPAMHSVMARSWEPGLAEYFHGDEPLESCLHHIEGVPLWFIPVGNVEENTVPLSKLPHLASVINTLKSRFRYILLDTPPILPLADINVLAGLAEILLLVVRSGRTPKDVVVKAADMLGPMAQSRIILTDAWSQGMPYYVRQGYEVPYAIGER